MGTTLFHRESDSIRLAKALKTLDLLVVQDLLPHEVCDYADYVLPPPTSSNAAKPPA